jgi:hypothetical protein
MLLCLKEMCMCVPREWLCLSLCRCCVCTYVDASTLLIRQCVYSHTSMRLLSYFKASTLIHQCVYYHTSKRLLAYVDASTIIIQSVYSHTSMRLLSNVNASTLLNGRGGLLSHTSMRFLHTSVRLLDSTGEGATRCESACYAHTHGCAGWDDTSSGTSLV